ncbi:hypothetical protein [Vasconcelosia minhoensis]|uniref:hypothetical protein n=1 Tax=Vasconcelosia minhoensis TaxID=3366354 RepID=UPI001D13346A|nr:hypothetical protein [Romeria gracilis]
MAHTALNALQNVSSTDISSTGDYVSEDHIADAILSVIQTARAKGQSLDELTAELLEEDALLESDVRYLLSEIVAQAWSQMA